MIRLQSGEFICEVEPAIGGCIRTLSRGGVPVLRPSPDPLPSARQSGSYPLVPFSNRIGHASLEWQGTQYPLVRHNAAEPHAIHGVGWQRPWEVLEAGPDSVLLSYEHVPDGTWPFAFDCSQALRLHGRGLTLALSMTNQSRIAAPAGLGWHPFFVKRPGARIRFESSGRWEMGEDKLPTHREPCPGLDAGCDGLDVDHCFDGWHGAVVLSDPAFTVRVTSGLSRLVVFTRPDRDSVAIEPVSHVNNAVHLALRGMDPASLGLVTLAPGETLSAEMSIEVDPAP